MGLALVSLSITGCSSGVKTQPEPIAYILDEGGVALKDSALRIDFGRTDQSAISAMTKLKGAKPNDSIDCSDGTAVRWADGTTLVFVGGDFRGWALGGIHNGALCQR